VIPVSFNFSASSKVKRIFNRLVLQ
jgi:hypothetical protein